MKLASPAQSPALVLLLSASLHLQASPLIATADVDPLILLPASPIVTRGMSRETVQFILGTPGARPLADMWVYWDFKVKGVPGNDPNDALLVGFKADRVIFLRLCPSESVRALIAQQKARPLQSTVAAK